MDSKYPNEIVQWTDKIDGKEDDPSYGDDIKAEHVNQLYAEVIAVETELNNAKLKPEFMPIEDINNIFNLDLSIPQDFYLEILNNTSKTINFNNIPQTDIVSVGIKLKFTDVAPISYPNNTTWINTFSPSIGKSYLILFMSYNSGSTWRATGYEI